MLGHAKELEKGLVYTAGEWDSPMFRIKSVKRGRDQTIITRVDGEKEILENMHAVRYFTPGVGPSKFGEDND